MVKLKLVFIMGLVTAAAILSAACTSENPGTTPAHANNQTLAPGTEDDGNKSAIIRDRAGRNWDVTHARDVYDMDPDNFNFGLGIGGIPSVDIPEILAEGDFGYPGSNSKTEVFGVNHNGEQRAYSVGALTRHEVFNDVFPGESGQYLAVTY